MRTMTSRLLKVVASDMDGTILNNEHALTPYTMETLYLLSLRNVPFVFCTGRHYLTALQTYNALSQYFSMRQEQSKKTCKLETLCSGGGNSESIVQNDSQKEIPLGESHNRGFYIVSSNGARVHSPSNELLREHNIRPEIVKQLYETFGLPYTTQKCTNTTALSSSNVSKTGTGSEEPKDTVFTSAFVTDAWFATTMFFTREKMQKKFGMIPFIPPFDKEGGEEGCSIFDKFPLEGVGKICFRCFDPSLLETFENEIVEMFHDDVSVCFSSPFCLDVMSKNVSKASALEDVCSALNDESREVKNADNSITMKNIVSFGDSMNDCEMLQKSGLGFIMSNGQERLKTALPNNEVIGHNNDDSVAKKLRKLFNITD